MGRVKRYKKFKSCDPFARKVRNGKDEDVSFDEPPQIFEEKKMKSEKRKERDWDDPDLQEKLIQQEAFRVISSRENKGKSKKLESKRDDESMRQFKTRIRQETRAVRILIH